MLITIPKTLEKDIMNFISINEIENVNEFLSSCLRNGFNIAKYGVSPQDNFKKENLPFKIENYEHTEEKDIGGLEKGERKKAGRPKKQEEPINKEVVESIEKEEKPIKPKKTIRIIKN